MELIAELFTALGEGAYQAAHYEIVTHEGPPARYLVCTETGALFVHIAEHGQKIAIMRSHRLLVHALDAIPSARVSSWSTT